MGVMFTRHRTIAAFARSIRERGHRRGVTRCGIQSPIMDTRFEDARRIRRRAPRFSLQLWFRANRWRGRMAVLASAVVLFGLGAWAAASAQPLSSVIEFRGASSIVIA